ncbi:MAG: pyridoxamine 5'-phosphate oxidase family protein [Pseudomonadota bacterium]
MTTPPPPKGARHRVRQSAKRAAYDRDTLYAVLDACRVGHVALIDNGKPISIPSAVARIGDALYLHGSNSSRLFKAMASGCDVCVSVCELDALVVARSAMHCSMNYRSAVVFGVGEKVDDADKVALLDAFTEHLIPGSRGHFRPHLAKEIKATTLIRIALDEASAKVRTGGPVDDEVDVALPIWAGVIPLITLAAAPIDAADLPAGVAPPPFATPE